MATSAPDDEGEDDEDLGEDQDTGEAGASESPLPVPGPKVRPPPPPLMLPRTRRGLAVTFALATLVLVNYVVIRPWCAKHGIRTYLEQDVACALRSALAFTALGLSLWSLVRRLSGRPFPKRTITAAAIVLGTFGVVTYISSDDLGAWNFVHKWELFHYYLGSKYPQELGYKRIYLCAAVAQSEMSDEERKEVLGRSIRDLDTDTVKEATHVLDNPEKCKDHFTEARWARFVKDVAWFRNNSERGVWDQMQQDHGYNGPPVWTMSGHLWGTLARTATNSSMHVLASLDTYVFGLTFFFIWWAFGLEICCLALLYWGTQFPADDYFTGAAFLRQDWLLFCVMAACLLRKRYWALAGAALATSALLRVFPGLFFAGIIVVALAHFHKHSRFAKHHLRVFMGAAMAFVVLVSASVAVVGAEAYPEFLDHIELHHRTPLTNNMGLSVMLSFTFAGRAELTHDRQAVDEFGRWVIAHKRALASRRPIYLLLNGFFLIIFVVTVRRIKSLWMAMGLSAILIVTIPTLTCYYYTFFLVPLLLAKASQRVARLALGTAGMSTLLVLWPRVSGEWDDRFTMQSLVFLEFALLLLLGFLHDPPAPKALPRKAAPV